MSRLFCLSDEKGERKNFSNRKQFASFMGLFSVGVDVFQKNLDIQESKQEIVQVVYLVNNSPKIYLAYPIPLTCFDAICIFCHTVG